MRMIEEMENEHVELGNYKSSSNNGAVAHGIDWANKANVKRRRLTNMSNIYMQEPATKGKDIMKTIVGDIKLEVWTKETPKACRNFIQLWMEGYQDDTAFHRIIKGFITQGGDPTGTGEGGKIYTEPFKEEFHIRLHFCRRDLIAMANAGKDDNGSQLLFTLSSTPDLQNKHAIFGKITGETIYYMLKPEETLGDEELGNYKSSSNNGAVAHGIDWANKANVKRRRLTNMSNIYMQEPATKGKDIMKTIVGDIKLEVWTKETPKACRNFIQLWMEGYQDDTAFHRIIKGFITQGGDPTGTGEGGKIYTEPFKEEFHIRLHFCRRDLIAMANAGKDDNGSQLLFTLSSTPDLQNKHAIFGKITGETIYYMLKPEETLGDEVVMKTTFGDFESELWTKETPKTSRNFIQLCMDGYWDDTIFHGIIKGFITQGGDPTGTGEGGKIYRELFKVIDKFHTRLRFCGRDLIAIANAGKDDNGSRFFFTLNSAPDLQNKHTIFGQVTEETIYDMLELEEVVMKTTFGDFESELWTKETPKTSRNFIQLCMDGYWDDTIFHGIIKGFITQGGDPTGTGEGGKIYRELFKVIDKFHTRLRFCGRDLIAIANAGKDDNGSRFFFTLNSAPDLQNKHTIFGQNDRAVYHPRLIKIIILNNPFSDITPRIIVQESEEVKDCSKNKAAARCQSFQSFSEEAEEDKEESAILNKKFSGKSKSAHDHFSDPKLCS
ncbi:Peptidyl-prolyl cis-trans isomerase CWC27 like protein [Eufriesea mexicana]|uniref:Spliceosome-associated protein CWC27 homolog n=1 Tax=Eufriesea mexicana TaxID=516756 RepID=A0A310SP80_9HYME|nr:Peptidyl-prolyl cis-trans isomerase CWC27 like protein [Eufriesea mexicana]